jgi:hypothetical protein
MDARQRHPFYCDKCVKSAPRFAHGQYLLNVVDLAIIDFLSGLSCLIISTNTSQRAGNCDRRHLFNFDIWLKGAHEPFILTLDNGKG